jgi:hypothetical protein
LWLLGAGGLAVAQSVDLTGDWRWSCCDKQHSGIWQITAQKADGVFTGKFSEKTPDDLGAIQGRVEANRVEFTRRGTVNGRPFEQHWTGTLAGDRIDGRLEYGSFTAERVPVELRGVWRWTCCGGAHSGRWEIASQQPDGTFAGKFGGSSAEDVGTIEGRVQGRKIEFVRRGSLGGQAFEQHWTGTVSGQTVRGKLEFGEFSAEKAETPASAVQEAPPSGGGICFDPGTLVIMDEWLQQAAPPQRAGETLRYEPWGRVVGSGPAPPQPQTKLSRCDWLWYHSMRLRSTNLGTLREYVDKRREER